MVWRAVEAAIAEATGAAFAVARASNVGGGCIHQGAVLQGRDGRRFFIKRNQAGAAGMFSAERAGLRALAAANAIRVPAPVAEGVSESQAWLVLEYLDLSGRAEAARMGQALAEMHRCLGQAYGGHPDNFIGATPQCNADESDWVTFLRQHRLRRQLQLAQADGAPASLLALGERLLADLPAFFADGQPAPSLLHGDLWGGNHAYLPDGTPVIFDPAVYFGDREADLAMTELFGGFGAAFYSAYQEAWPLDPGYAVRKHVYNLYHVLNHAHLFGGGYARQAESMMHRVLAELR